MSRGNIKQARQYQPNPNNNNNNPNNSNSPNNNNNQNQQQQQQQQQQSPNELTLDAATKRALDAVTKARMTRSPYMILEPNITYRLQFYPAKMHIETKTFNGMQSERISHSVVDLDDPERVEKILSLTFKQSKIIEEAYAQGYLSMEVTKIGEAFNLTYQENPIE